jgi:CMP-N-acetylneuraminic acid synthetase
MDELAVESIISVCEAEHSPLWVNTLPASGNMARFIKRKVGDTKGNSADKYYRINGAIYLINKKMFMLSKSLLNDKTIAYVMPQIRSVDIDTEIDFCLAETLMKKRQVNDPQ